MTAQEKSEQVAFLLNKFSHQKKDSHDQDNNQQVP